MTNPAACVSAAEPLLIELSWPAKQLSPNARIHHMARHRYAKAAKTEAGWATKAARPFHWGSDGPFDVHIIAYPPKTWREGDNDNFIARLKAHFDGIAAALGVNDRLFGAPTIKWADRTERGKVVIRIAEAA
jgi:crossover junction endodeoxyribonuclease RusA